MDFSDRARNKNTVLDHTEDDFSAIHFDEDVKIIENNSQIPDNIKIKIIRNIGEYSKNSLGDG